MTLVDGTDVAGELTRVDSGGIGLYRRDGLEASIARVEIGALHAERSRFPQVGASLLGFALGTIAGAYIEATDERGFDANDGSSVPSVYRSNKVLVGAVTGLAIGTIVPLIHPGEEKIECAWAPPTLDLDGSFSSSSLDAGRRPRGLRIGALAGATYGYSSQRHDFDRIKPFGGARAEYVLRNGLGAQLGLQWSPKGLGALRSTYLAAPARAVYRFGGRRLRSSLALGIEAAYLLDAHYRFRDFHGNPRREDITDEIERWDLGISMGTTLGVSDPIEIGFEFVPGIRPFQKTPWAEERNRSLWLFTSIWFDIG